MKILFLLFFPILSMAATPFLQQSGLSPVNVMTFNIRYDNPDDSLNNWSYRRDKVANAVLFYDVDIIGTQEVLHNQLIDLQNRLPGYGYVGVGREDGKEKGEYCPLWYKESRFNLIESGCFWLSETPEKAGSKGWDGACERIASWAKLLEKYSGKEYFILNTHLDHVGVTARREGVKLLLQRVKQLSDGLPVVVTGDFNATPESDVIRNLTDTANTDCLIDSRSLSPVVYGPSWSFHDFGRIPFDKRELIDFIFVRNHVRVLRYGIIVGADDGTYLSDHAPVLITIE